MRKSLGLSFPGCLLYTRLYVLFEDVNASDWAGEAKLFGGSNVIAALSSVGTKNAAFAKAFLADEGIAVTGGSLGGTLPRRIQYWPATGRVRQLEVQADPKALLDRELSMAVSAPPPPDDVELF